MHPNIKKGQEQHRDHFRAISEKGLAPNWEVWSVDSVLKGSRLRPDWIIVNRIEKRAFVIDLTSKYRPSHYEKGLEYKAALERILSDPTWEVVYIEDYWLNATIH